MAEKRKVIDTRFMILIGLHLSIGAIIAALILSKDPSATQEKGLREVAAKLQAAGVTDEAIDYYTQYFNTQTLDAASRAKIAYSIADLYAENGELRKSLAWYYRVQTTAPKSQQATDASKRIVGLLERLGKVSAAKQELKNQTSLDRSPAKKGGTVVAKVGEKNIYLFQINEAIDQLPEQIRGQFKSKEGKQQFLRKFVSDEILRDKAIRLEYDQKPELVKQLNDIKKQLLVQEVVKEEVYLKLDVSETDLSNYFEANKDKYVQKERATVSLIKVKGKKLAKDLHKQIRSGKDFATLAKKHSLDEATKAQGGRYPGFVQKGESFLANDTKISEAILKSKKGTTTKPQLSQGYYYLVKVHEKEAEKRPQFNQIKERVTNDYRMQKGQEKYQALIESSLQGESVQLFAERIQ